MRGVRVIFFALLLVVPKLCFAQEIAEIEVRGELRKVAESLIITAVGLEPGVELSQENVQQAVRDLQRLNVFADIQIWGEPVEDGMKLIIVVSEYPSLQGVRFKGNVELKEKEMKETLGLVVGQVLAEKDVVRGQQKILGLYREKGYLRAEVTGQTFDGEKAGEVFLQYQIEEGEKVRVKGIRLLQRTASGSVIDSDELPLRNPRIPRAWPYLGPMPQELRRLMATKTKMLWRKGEFSGDSYEEDKEKILRYYRTLGFQQVGIVRDSVYYDSTRQDLFVEIEIDEGFRYHLGDVSFSGNTVLSRESLEGKIILDKGEVYGLTGPELAELVRFAYYEKGYLDTRVSPIETVRQDTIDVSFQVFEGEPWTVRRVEIAGNTKTHEKVIRREIELRPGEIYQQDLIQESQRRIYMLNYFKDVQIQPEYSPIEGERLVDLTFNVEEQPTGQASMGAGYSDRDKLVGQIGLRVPNFRGRGQNVDFSWEFGTRREQFLLGFTEPWLFDTPTSLSIRVYTLNNDYYDYYDFKRNSISARVGRRLKKPAYSSISFGYRLESEKYKNFGENFDPDLRTSNSIYRGRYEPMTTSSFELVFSRDTRDQADFPTKGSQISYRPELATSLVAGDVDFHKHEIIGNYYRPSWWKFVLSVESKISIVDGFSDYDDQSLSVWERFSPGGVDMWDGQVRGYPDRSLGPRSSLGGVPLGGRSMMILNLEYRFPVAEKQVYGILFADAGNAWEDIPDLDPLDLRKSLGFGFRVMTPMLGLIGFDFGYGFDRKNVDGLNAGWSTHFQFGPQFF